MPSDERTLILCDGSLASLVACAIAAERTPADLACATLVAHADAFDRARSDAAKAQCAHFDLPLVDLAPVDRSGVDIASGMVLPTDGPAATRALVAIAHGALHEGIARIVWPVHLGCPDDQPDDPPSRPPDPIAAQSSLDELADVLDRALLVARLASLDAPVGVDVQIQTPLIDLSDAQLGELAMDLGAPVELCWWWGPGKAGDHLPARLYRRWTTALRGLGWARAEV